VPDAETVFVPVVVAHVDAEILMVIEGVEVAQPVTDPRLDRETLGEPDCIVDLVPEREVVGELDGVLVIEGLPVPVIDVDIVTVEDAVLQADADTLVLDVVD
jgi:hypothetical protein